MFVHFGNIVRIADHILFPRSYYYYTDVKYVIYDRSSDDGAISIFDAKSSRDAFPKFYQ